ncbi:MAG: beta-lysine 5,6-aminomutase alpha subunit, partial [Mycobacteriales bacterium]
MTEHGAPNRRPARGPDRVAGPAGPTGAGRGERAPSKLGLDARLVRKARRLAAAAAEPVIELARTHTTTSVERATLRLAGLSGADPAYEGGTQPWANTVVDAVREQVGLEHGVA